MPGATEADLAEQRLQVPIDEDAYPVDLPKGPAPRGSTGQGVRFRSPGGRPSDAPPRSRRNRGLLTRNPLIAACDWAESSDRSDWCERTEPSDWFESIDSRLIDDPNEPNEANDHTLPTERNDPTEPIDSTDPTEPIESTELRDPIDIQLRAIGPA